MADGFCFLFEKHVSLSQRWLNWAKGCGVPVFTKPDFSF